ncbi:MAG: hypothetical protein FJW35_03210 [Acidobacteria bacterium]|nr:hypothetical protein [Acidobacteriota bacterium]
MDLQIDRDRNIARIKLSGSLSKETILDAFDAAVSDEGYRKGMGRLWDFRDADLSSMGPTTIAELARHSMKYPRGINDVRVALVAGSDLEFGLARMFAAFSIDAHTTISVFNSMEEAQAWLSIPAAEGKFID